MNVQAIRHFPRPVPAMEIVLNKTAKQCVHATRQRRGLASIVPVMPNSPVLDTVHVHQMPRVIVTIGNHQRTSIGLE